MTKLSITREQTDFVNGPCVFLSLSTESAMFLAFKASLFQSLSEVDQGFTFQEPLFLGLCRSWAEVCATVALNLREIPYSEVFCGAKFSWNHYKMFCRNFHELNFHGLNFHSKQVVQSGHTHWWHRQQLAGPRKTVCPPELIALLVK